MDYIFELTQKVRDYECDMQGIVNNAVYLFYVEMTRHEFFETRGISFKSLIDEGIIAVVSRLEIEYKRPLRSGDRFAVKINLGRRGPRLLFFQDIFKLSENGVYVRAKVEVVGTVNGKLSRGDIFNELFAPATRSRG
jgi:acyl-CoA thioester hydrolase